MNQAMPQWRTFSSDDADTTAAEPPEPTPAATTIGTWLAAAVGALVGFGVGAGVAGLLLFVLAGAAPEDAADWGVALDAGDAAADSLVAQEPSGSAEIVVDVAGAVVRPGLQRLAGGRRVGDAIEAAGGYAPRVDLVATSAQLNLAQVLTDGAKVLVPELSEGTSRGRRIDDTRIDINRAGQSELESLPGIGPVTAREIIAAREERGFDDVRDLRTRGLIGPSVLEKIGELVRA